MTNLINNSVEAGGSEIKISALKGPDPAIFNEANGISSIPTEFAGRVLVNVFHTCSFSFLTNLHLGKRVLAKIVQRFWGVVRLGATDSKGTLAKVMPQAGR